MPQVQPFNFTELNAFNDQEVGALFTRENGSILSFSMNVVADPCPSTEWTFNGVHLRPSDVVTFNNPCTEENGGLNWTFTLNVTITIATSGSYSAKLKNIAGTTQVPKVYFTIPGMSIEWYQFYKYE